ncbi:putative receptor protein kinase [Spatholobus suberectus]|nr:putative receptor protein kinase [Spatholobus suberectus]
MENLTAGMLSLILRWNMRGCSLIIQTFGFANEACACRLTFIWMIMFLVLKIIGWNKFSIEVLNLRSTIMFLKIAQDAWEMKEIARAMCARSLMGIENSTQPLSSRGPKFNLGLGLRTWKISLMDTLGASMASLILQWNMMSLVIHSLGIANEAWACRLTFIRKIMLVEIIFGNKFWIEDLNLRSTSVSKECTGCLGMGSEGDCWSDGIDKHALSCYYCPDGSHCSSKIYGLEKLLSVGIVRVVS